MILEHHGLVDRNSPTKPGMVHISTSLTEASDADESGSGTEENDMNDVYKDDKFSISESRRVKKEVITAHINMKSSNTAWHAYGQYF